MSHYTRLLLDYQPGAPNIEVRGVADLPVQLLRGNISIVHPRVHKRPLRRLRLPRPRLAAIFCVIAVLLTLEEHDLLLAAQRLDTQRCKYISPDPVTHEALFRLEHAHRPVAASEAPANETGDTVLDHTEALCRPSLDAALYDFV
jgi:hypothetical protein